MSALDSGIERLVDAIKAIDDHTHLPIFPEAPADMDRPFDPYDRFEIPTPQRLRSTNPPEYLHAWRGLWDYEHDDWSDDHLRELIVKREKIRTEVAGGFDAWILDKLNFETMLYVAPGPLDKPAPGYRWIYHFDALLWPCQSSPADQQTLIAAYRERMRAMCAQAGHGEEVPATLAAFLDDIVDPALQSAKDRGAIAMKSNAPYYRSLSFADVPIDDAERLYARGALEGELPVADHRALQDYLFRHIVRRAGELGLPIQMHTGLGIKPHFQTIDSNPQLLDPLVAAFPDTQFVLLHTGWPFDSQARTCLAHGNVWLDISCTSFEVTARTFSEMVRKALEVFPSRILFGTDAHSDDDEAFLCSVPVKPNPLAGWEEKAWLANWTSRRSLTMALSVLHDDRDITAARADELALMVMRDNSLDLYDL